MDADIALGIGQAELDNFDDSLKSTSRLLSGGPYNNKTSYYRDKDNTEEEWLSDIFGENPEADNAIFHPIPEPETPKPSSNTLPARVQASAQRLPKPRKPLPVSTPISPVRPCSPIGISGGFQLAPEKLTPKQVGDAKLLNLLRTPSNPAAGAFIAEVERRLLNSEAWSGNRQRARRGTAKLQFHQAVAAIVANALLAWSHTPPLPTSRTLHAASFTGGDIGYPAFTDAVRWLKQANLLYQRRGGRSKDGTKGNASRFWPTSQLLTLAATYGIDINTVAEDFGFRRSTSLKAPKVHHPIRMKAISAHPNALRGPNLYIDPHDLTGASLRAEVDALNRFAATIDVQGCRPPRWQRLFRGDFRLYGRLHTVGDGSYQSMPAHQRVADIRIAGEPVVEIDINASHLSIMHGLMRLPLPEGDLYAVPGFPRPVIKAWINATLGNGSPVRKWPKNLLEKKPALAEVDPLAVMAAVLRRYPWLAEPWRLATEFAHIAKPKRVLPHLLMGIESDIMLAVMQELHRQGILGLPIHDGILVPVSAEALVCDALTRAGQAIANVNLRFKISSGESISGVAHFEGA